MASIKERLAALQKASGGGAFVPSRGPDPTWAGYEPGTAAPRRSVEALPVEVQEGGAITERRAALTAAANRSAEAGPREQVVKDASISGFRPAYGSTASAEPEEAPPEDFGAPVAAGWLRKNGKGLKAKVYTPLWCALHSEPPLLAFYADERASRPKLVLRVTKRSAVRAEGEFLVLHTDAEDLADVVGLVTKRVVETRLQGGTAEEAAGWATRIEEVVRSIASSA